MADPTTSGNKQRSYELRNVVANILMTIFILSTSVGATLLWSVGAGLLALGLTAAAVGYLLGAE